MRMTPRSRQTGVGLIELMVSVLVLSIGLVALARLQIELVRGAADSRARSAAVALAEEKLEDLRSYARVEGTDDWTAAAATAAPPSAGNPLSYIDDSTFETTWEYITHNPGSDFGERGEGGRILPQTVELEGVQYTLDWTVSTIPYESPAPGLPTPFKDVTVTVAWEDSDADTPTQQVQLTGSIMGIPPGNVIAASQPVSARPPGPEVLYTPGQAPEIISVPIDVGGGKRRETTKPLPDVVGNSGTNVVRFDVVNYHQNGSEFIVDKREEFITVNCACQVGSAGPARTPARTVFQNGTIRDVPGLVVTKTRGNYTANGSSFDDVCVICCRDHYDYTAGSTQYRYRKADASNHGHYVKSSSGNPVTGPVGSGNYDEACRLKRVNGVFQVFEDWALADLTVLPGSFLTDSTSQATYQTYVQDVVKAKVLGTGAPAKPSGRDTSVVSGQFNQLFGRAVYVDLPDGLATFVQTQVSGGADFRTFLGIVPFYEINLTKLADWATLTAATVVRATSSDVQDEGENQDNYSRGRAEGAASSATPSSSVRTLAIVKPGNTGITSTAAVRPDEDAIHTRTLAATVSGKKYYTTAVDPTTETPTEHRDDSILVTFSGVPVGPTCPGDPSCPPTPPVCPGDPSCPAPTSYHIAGDLFKATGAQGQPQTSVTVAFSGTASGTCAINKQGNNADYDCTVPSGWTGNITFSPAANQYCTVAGCTTGTALVNDQRAYTNVTTGFGEEDLWVKN